MIEGFLKVAGVSAPIHSIWMRGRSIMFKASIPVLGPIESERLYLLNESGKTMLEATELVSAPCARAGDTLAITYRLNIDTLNVADGPVDRVRSRPKGRSSI